jgi:energy-coupling factor transporter transmembrane protein EcfT
MKKYFIVSSLFALLILSTSVFAQTKLDPNIYDENGFRKDQNISELIKNRSEQRGTSTQKQESLLLQNNVLKGELGSCFDYYTFGSIKVNLTEDTETYSPGDPVVLNGKISNDNPYPIIDLTIRGRLVKDTPNPVYLRSEIITLEDFIILENVTIPANSSIDVNYAHLLPINSSQGEYQMYFYAYNNDRFSQSGLSFTNDVVASKIDFSILGDNPQQVYLDQTRITLNDKEHNVMAFPTHHDKDEIIKIDIPLVNPSDKDEIMEIVYTLYKWDGLRKENIVDTKTETITVLAKNEKLLTYTVSNTDTSVYFLNIKADNKTFKKDKSVYDIETQSNIRFSVSGYDFPIIDSFGINTYPIKENSEVTMFTCFHSGAFQDTSDEFNIKTQILDNKGKMLSETEYQGKLDKKIKAIINKFTPTKDFSNFKIITTMTDSNGKVIDTIEDEYKCEDLDQNLCPKTPSFTVVQTLIIIFILIVLVLFIIFIKKIKNKIPTVMFVLFLLISSFILFPNDSEASKVTYSPSYSHSGGEQSNDLFDWMFNFEKEFNFIGQNEIKMTNNFQLDVGKSVAVENNPTTGAWFLSGSIDNSPPMDGIVYWSGDEGVAIYGTKRGGKDLFSAFGVVSVPIERGIIEINSNNPGVVSCTNGSCTAVSPGVANVTVRFINDPSTGGFGLVNAIEGFNEGNPDVSFNVVFSFNNIVYTVTVPEVINTPQGASTCTTATNESRTTSQVNWLYSDPDNEANPLVDPQTGYQVQVALDQNFNNVIQSLVKPANTDVSAVRSRGVSGLDPNTKYYYRVKTQNNTNGWNEYSVCTSVPAVNADTRDLANTSVTIWWNYMDSLPQDNYQVRVSENADFSNPKTDIRGKAIAMNTKTDNFFVRAIKKIFRMEPAMAETSIADTREVPVTGLKPSTLYYAQVRASNENGWGEWSNITFTTLGNGLIVSCESDPSSVVINKGVSEWSGTINFSALVSGGTGTYRWLKNNAPLSGETSGSYSDSYTINRQSAVNNNYSYFYDPKISVEVKDSLDNIKTAICKTQVVEVGENISTDPSLEFTILPKLAPNCIPKMNVKDVKSCKIMKGGTQEGPTYTANGSNKIEQDGQKITNPGMYNLECIDVSDETKISNYQSCISDFTIIQD